MKNTCSFLTGKAISPRRSGKSLHEKNTNIDIAAYHEVGHALAALRESRRVVGVLISRTHPGNGSCWYAAKPRNPHPIDQNPGSAKAAWLHTVETTCADIRIALAGPIAEAKALGTPLRSLGSRSDLENCLRLARRLSTLQSFVSELAEVPPVDPHSILEREQRSVGHWIGRPATWRTIQLVARALMFRGALTPEFLHFWIGVAASCGRQAQFFLRDIADSTRRRDRISDSRMKDVKMSPAVQYQPDRTTRAA